jgi:hypothetical protein
MNPSPSSKIGPVTAIAGAILLFVGTWIHPMNADPNIPLDAFTEYAGAHNWIAGHLIQFLGVLLMTAALILLLRRMDEGPSVEWALLATLAAIAGLAVAGVLQAVDGIALKAAVDRWWTAPADLKTPLYHDAVVVRQIEISLASVSSLLFGVAIAIAGVALWLDQRLARWIGLLALVAGSATTLAGIVMAYTGFSGPAMELNMSAGSILILLMLALGIHGWLHHVF